MREADLDSRLCQTKIRPKIRLEIVLQFGDQYVQVALAGNGVDRNAITIQLL